MEEEARVQQSIRAGIVNQSSSRVRSLVVRIHQHLILNLAILLAIPLTSLAIIALSSGNAEEVELIFDYVTTSSIR